MEMKSLVGTVIGVTVSIIVIASVLAPQITLYSAEGAALHEWAGLLGAVVVLCIVGALMAAVSLISKN